MAMKFKRLLILGLLMLSLAALPVMAQESGSAEAQTAAQVSGGSGITTLVILSGLGAVVVVGGLMYRRENSKSGKEVD
jgi:hypothetical protein